MANKTLTVLYTNFYVKNIDIIDMNGFLNVRNRKQHITKFQVFLQLVCEFDNNNYFGK